MFVQIRFRTSIQLKSNELDDDFEDQIINNLKKKYEGICSKYGYIKPGSITVLKRSIGCFIKQHFNGFIKFDIICKAETCNPSQGMTFEAEVKNKNNLGLLAETTINVDGKDVPILDVIIPKRSAGIISEIDLDNIKVGDKINIVVLGKKYQLNDSKISIIGKAVRTEKQINIHNIENEESEEEDDEEEIIESEEEEDEDQEGGKKKIEGEVLLDEVEETEYSDDEDLSGEEEEYEEYDVQEEYYE